MFEPVALVAFFQWLLIGPLLYLLWPTLGRIRTRIWIVDVFAEVLAAGLLFAAVMLIPLMLFGWWPLRGEDRQLWGAAGLCGGALGILLSKFVKSALSK